MLGHALGAAAAWVHQCGAFWPTDARLYVALASGTVVVPCCMEQLSCLMIMAMEKGISTQLGHVCW